jgi:hypothetical protein
LGKGKIEKKKGKENLKKKPNLLHLAAASLSL